jgi:predicted nucleic acid-binding protein
MKTIGLDTNSILNYSLNRKPHFETVKKVFERCLEGKIEIFIPAVVFLECE